MPKPQMQPHVVYGDCRSGNCLKVKWTAALLNLPVEWREVDLMSGFTRTEEFLRINPAGQTPALVLPDGRSIAQSGAIMIYFAEGSELIPADAFDRAKMFEWMFFEQYSHEPAIAVRRWQKTFLQKSEDEIDPNLMIKGRRALGVMEQAIMARDFFAGETLSLADIALVAYTRLAHEGGFDLREFPAVQAWIDRVERELSLPSAREAA